MHQRDTILQHSERRLQRNLLDRIFFILDPVSSLFPTCILYVFITWSTAPILLLGMLGPRSFFLVRYVFRAQGFPPV